MKTTTIPPSPFLYQRKEREPFGTKIFINQSDFQTWNGANNCLIIGSRGSGKSSVLTAFDYRVQWLKPEILQMPDKFKMFFPETPNVIGMFFRCDNIEVSLWNKWRDKTGSDDHRTSYVFSTYMTYVWVEKIIQAIIHISEKFPEVFNTEGSNPSALVADILEICFSSKDHPKPSLYSHSLAQLVKFTEGTYKAIRQNVFVWRSIEKIEQEFCLHESASDTLRKVCVAVTQHLPFFKGKRFFFLLDDIDTFSEWQVMVINSMMKVASDPYSFKLSCTRDYRTMLTFADDRALSSTDLHISWLNDDEGSGKDVKEKKREELFNAILNIRLSEISDLPQNNSKYSIDELFGKHDIEELLMATLKRKSIGTNVQKLLEEFKNSGYERLTDYWTENKIFNKVRAVRKKRDKYRISSALSILRDCKLKGSFIYCSCDMIQQITGGSPRNFLRICHAMWEAIYITLSNEISEVPIEDQNKAIRVASASFFENINKDRFSSKISTSTYEMCSRLTTIFDKFVNNESLRITPECLSLKMDDTQLLGVQKETWETIYNRLLMMEVIKTRRDSTGNKDIQIALSPMLSPHFCLSYRSPFSYSFTLKDANVMIRLFTTEHDKAASQIIADIYRSRIKEEPQPQSDLF